MILPDNSIQVINGKGYATYRSRILFPIGSQIKSVKLIAQASQLHDFGKIGIPDSILHKPRFVFFSEE